MSLSILNLALQKAIQETKDYTNAEIQLMIAMQNSFSVFLTRSIRAPSFGFFHRIKNQKHRSQILGNILNQHQSWKSYRHWFRWSFTQYPEQLQPYDWLLYRTYIVRKQMTKLIIYHIIIIYIIV